MDKDSAKAPSWLGIGSEYRSYGRTLVLAEVEALVEIFSVRQGENSIDVNGLGMDPAKVGQQVPACVTWMMMEGLHSTGPAYHALRQEGGIRVLAQLELGLHALGGAHIGETLYVETSVVGGRKSRQRPGRGIMTVRDIGFVEDGRKVGKIVRTWLVERESNFLGEGE